MNKSTQLSKAKINKADEFYTQLQDIENEVMHYKDYFRGKIVYCNCDDENSNFWKYFSTHFSDFQLKELYASGINGFLFHMTSNDTTCEKLQSGDFRSDECREILNKCDVVCTNPPFSLFNSFVQTVLEYGKKILVIGNQNAITNSFIFSSMKNHELWTGYGFKGDAAYFINNHYKDYATSGIHKEGMIRVSGVMWYTNIETDREMKKLTLTAKFNPQVYPKYDDFDAINVDKYKDIPCDYYEPMGVPITFMKHYNPEQFEILGVDKDFSDNGRKGRFKINGKTKYARIVIKRK